MSESTMTIDTSDMGSATFSREQLAAQKPNDNLSFGELQEAYNFRNVSDRRRVFANLIVKDLESRTDPVVLLSLIHI